VAYLAGALRVVAVVLAIVALPALARSDDNATPPVACELTTDVAVDLATSPISTPAPEPPEVAPIDPRVAAGEHWRLETTRGPVHVWVPPDYNAATAATVVFVHGYNTDVDTMWTGALLPEQFARSGVNAMFIACEAPYGKLAPMVWPSLDGLLASVAAGTGKRMPHGRLVTIGHSGAYRTIVLWLANRALSTVVLLDGAYGELDRFAEWVRVSRNHRFINIAYETQSYSDFMHQAMPGTFRVDGLPETDFEADARAARVLYVRTDVGHWPLVTGGVAIPAALRALGVPRG
jgi:hypothetical protein